MYKTKLLFSKTCQSCKNNCTVTGIEEDRQVGITTRKNVGDYFDKPTCWLVADTMVKCLCGRKFRMMSRKAYENSVLEAL